MAKVNRKDPTGAVVKAAESVMQEVRGKALYLIPFRMMHHLPNHGALIRPVDTVRATFIGTGIGTTGFRRYEPCCANDPIPEIGVRRFIVGRNHRNASTRDLGQVLIPTNRTSRKRIQELMGFLKA